MFEITITIKADSQEAANLIKSRLQMFSDSMTAKQMFKLSKTLLDKINTIKTLFV